MPEPVMYGGQAVIEGVMMRSPDTLAIACRRPDGQLVVHSEPVRATLMGRLTWLNRPFLRGTFAILDAIVLGMKALAFAANVQAAAEAERTAAASRAAGKNPPRSELGDIAIGATLVLSAETLHLLRRPKRAGLRALLAAEAPSRVCHEVRALAARRVEALHSAIPPQKRRPYLYNVHSLSRQGSRRFLPLTPRGGNDRRAHLCQSQWKPSSTSVSGGVSFSPRAKFTGASPAHGTTARPVSS